MIGDEVIVEIDYGRSLNQQLKLELDKVISTVTSHITDVFLPLPKVTGN